jgi:hypothetical protein
MNFFFNFVSYIDLPMFVNLRHMEFLNDFFISYFFRGSGYFSNIFSFSPVDPVSWFFQNEHKNRKPYGVKLCPAF